ncbi:MAG: adenylate/guanylate cyclase domain-containing protein [Solirubrobacteraceae bacterium]
MPASQTLTAPLDAIARGLEQTNWAAEVLDPQWRLIWLSSQLKTLLREHDDEALGVGMHMLESRLAPAWQRAFPRETEEQWLRDNAPHMIDDTPGGRDELIAMVRPQEVELMRALPAHSWPLWTALADSRGSGLELGNIRYFGARARTADGETLCIVYIYGSSLPASLLSLVARGDRHMFERMARLVEPGRREAAVLFADLQASGALSRHLPSASYFDLIRELTTAMDAEICRAGGIVGKHAGDGVSAFFLAADLGSTSAAAAAAIAAGRALVSATAHTAERVAGLGAGELALNVGIHWGSALYMGQLSTDGRLEVTALGDEVNECARVQESASDGALLATKSLIERLDVNDAARLGVDPHLTSYRALAEFSGVSAKAVRDAGTLAIAALEHRASAAC